jgi:hypothetical protein
MLRAQQQQARGWGWGWGWGWGHDPGIARRHHYDLSIKQSIKIAP